MENEKAKNKFKVMLVSMSIVVCVFLLAGIVLTFVLKSKQNTLNLMNQQNTQLEQEYNQNKEQSDYYNSDKYKDDYYENEENYGNKGDKIVEVQ